MSSSCSISPSLTDKPPRYLHSFTWGSSSPSPSPPSPPRDSNPLSSSQRLWPQTCRCCLSVRSWIDEVNRTALSTERDNSEVPQALHSSGQLVQFLLVLHHLRPAVTRPIRQKKNACRHRQPRPSIHFLSIFFEPL